MQDARPVAGEGVSPAALVALRYATFDVADAVAPHLLAHDADPMRHDRLAGCTPSCLMEAGIGDVAAVGSTGVTDCRGDRCAPRFQACNGDAER
jgi:hypothetical protein